MSFVKFVSKQAPEPRYDIALQYRTVPSMDDNGDDKDDE